MVGNVIAWFVLAWLLSRLIPGNDWRDWLARAGVLLSAGAIGSIRLALTDLITLALVAGAILALERRRNGWPAGLLAVAGIGRGTALLALPSLASPPWLSWINLRRSLLIVTPCAIALAWSGWRFGLKVQEFWHFDMPAISYLGEWFDSIEAIFQGRNLMMAWASLLILAGLTVQGVYFVRHRCRDEPWWRLGAASVVLLLFLNRTMWMGAASGAERLLLPLSLAFNVLVRRSRASAAWLLAGNLAVVAGFPGLFYPLEPSSGVAAIRAAGSAQIATLGRDWSVAEQNLLHTWSWSRSSARLQIETWPHRSQHLAVRFALRSLAPRTVIIRQDGQELWKGAVDGHLSPVQFTCRVTAGQAVLQLVTDSPAVVGDNGPDARALAFAVYDPILALAEP